MILSIDASTTGCSVALISDGRPTVSLNSKIQHSAAESITLMIDRVMKTAGIVFSDLKAVAVAKGPGSYTGLRIAVSTAKGLAFSLDLPILSYSTLQVLSYQITNTHHIDWICPMIDARRMEVYCGFYDAKTKEEVREVEAVIIDENSFADILNSHSVLFIGEGSHKCRGVINHHNALFADEINNPHAAYSAQLLEKKYGEGEFEDLETFEPFYLKEYMFKTKKLST